MKKAHPLRLSRDRRLSDARDFAVLREAGERRVCGCLIVNWRRRAKCGPSRVGLVVSRRVGGAVVRSRARRWMREAFRQQQGLLREPVDVVLVARPSLAGQSLATVVRDLRRGLAGLWIEDGVSGGV